MSAHILEFPVETRTEQPSEDTGDGDGGDVTIHIKITLDVPEHEADAPEPDARESIFAPLLVGVGLGWLLL